MINSTIIIPTAGRIDVLIKAIESILRLDLQKNNSELIIVDNNSDPLMSQILMQHCIELQGRLRYVHEPSPGLTAARHRGARESNGEILIFLDDDVEVSEGWLDTIHKGFLDDDVVMIGGPSIPKFDGSIPSWFWSFFTSTPYGGWMCSWLSLSDIGSDVKGVDPNYIWGLNFSIRKSVLYELGGFHPDLVPKNYQCWQGDGETGLTMKVRDSGRRADYLKGALVFHQCGQDRLNLEYFKKRAFYHGVSDSYANIRSRNNKSKLIKSNSPQPFFDSLRTLKANFKKMLINFCLDKVYAVNSGSPQIMTKYAERQGWLFHQEQVKMNPSLLPWILRDNYFDTDIRELK
ncbi:glycosyltransferase [Polynucleobacter brandtiae]|uniref:GT2 family glycosyltransferase n=1 Tax=Polynucleobacter brandtiae TaxID=1938816 RepID=A0A2M8VJI3_9BURK|nr:glycosyltransferase family 2 protein [Polynucleobacter brandtiae]PJI77156.1 GT2 family glycosyltransferase [Polynucleobacter brandtiae]